MEIILSFLIAYLLLGYSQVAKDLSSPKLHRPGWAIQPTLWFAVLVALFWVVRPIRERTSPGARGIAFGVLGVVLPLTTMSFFVYLCIVVSVAISSNLLAQILIVAVLIVVGSLFVIPIVNILMIPLMLLLAWPLNLLFPIKDEQHVEDKK